MKIYRFKLMIPALVLSAVLLVGIPAVARAQCGGGSGYMHNQHMGSSGQMGMYGNQPPVQSDPNAGYVAPAPPASNYTGTPQDTSGNGSTMGSGGSGQMMGQGGMSTGHQGHMSH